jgi:Lipid A 3-O-deacylase (PagL)
MARAVILLLFLLWQPAMAADRQWGLAFARGTESDETDIVRLTYRHPLKENGAWWKPSHVQLGAGVWRVPDIRGTTRRLDASVSAIWRGDKPWGYLEAGFGGYLLSKTINNDENRLPSAFEFGSHIGAGMRFAKNHTLGIGLQHMSNAGIKQPNGGIDLVMVQYNYSFTK